MTNSKILDIDEAKMYVGRPFQINDKITIYQPKVGEIIDFGERQYYGMIHSLTCIPSDMKSQLNDIGMDYMKTDDFELFLMLSRSLNSQMTKLVLGDIDLSSFILCTDEDNGNPVLFDEENEIKIDKYIYLKMTEYIRKIHNIKPKVEKASSETVRKILIQLERDKIRKSQEEPYVSNLKYLLSAMMRYPGCTMTLEQLLELPLCAFMDLVQGSQIYVSSSALLQGSYSGMIDTSKINKKEFNWMRGLDD